MKEQFSQSSLEVRPLPGSRVTTTPAHTQGASVPVSGALAKGLAASQNFGNFLIFRLCSTTGITGKKRRSPKLKSDISFFSRPKNCDHLRQVGLGLRGCVRRSSCCTRVVRTSTVGNGLVIWFARISRSWLSGMMAKLSRRTVAPFAPRWLSGFSGSSAISHRSFDRRGVKIRPWHFRCSTSNRHRIEYPPSVCKSCQHRELGRRVTRP